MEREKQRKTSKVNLETYNQTDKQIESDRKQTIRKRENLEEEEKGEEEEEEKEEEEEAKERKRN